MIKRIFAIDPGNVYSGFCIMEYETLKPLRFGKVENTALQALIETCMFEYSNEALRDRNVSGAPPEPGLKFCIEMIASYGMPVGKEVFDTCVWIGRFYEGIQASPDAEIQPPALIYRKDEKMTICHSLKANDANLRRALIDRFAKHDFRTGKGTKNNPDWFYGFKADVWQAYAVGVTFKEMEREHGKE